jgi:hypothetical protein
MLELLKFVLDNPYNFIGTVILLVIFNVLFGAHANDLVTLIYAKKTELAKAQIEAAAKVENQVT